MCVESARRKRGVKVRTSPRKRTPNISYSTDGMTKKSNVVCAVICSINMLVVIVVVVVVVVVIGDHLQENRAQRGTLQKKFLLHLRSCRRPDIELSKFYRRSLSCSRYNRPNRSLPSA